jgi:SAM-dependent methyltransferase
MIVQTQTFYDDLAPFYHLIFQDWEASITRHGTQLDTLIKDQWGEGVQTVLDVACGIGTQSLGLAELGYQLTASDLSPEAIKRAQMEATRRGLAINFSVADMRRAFDHHQETFDVLIACDNAVPHLLTNEEILAAFQQFYQCLKPGGGVLLSVRDYDSEVKEGIQLKPHGVRVEKGVRYLVFQVWEFEANSDIYEVSMYFVADEGGADCHTMVTRAKYYAVGIDTLLGLLREAGFRQVARLNEGYFQPILLATK